MKKILILIAFIISFIANSYVFFNAGKRSPLPDCISQCDEYGAFKSGIEVGLDCGLEMLKRIGSGETPSSVINDVSGYSVEAWNEFYGEADGK